MINNKYEKTISLYDDGVGKIQYIQHFGEDKTIVNSARVSFGQDNNLPLDDRDERLIKYLVRHRHTSTMEHCSVTFKLTVPLYIARQHMRHRTWSYNEISRRYTDINIKFYEPDAFRTQHVSNRQASNSCDLINPLVDTGGVHGGAGAAWLIKDHHKKSFNLYNKLIDSGICREQARGVLPQNMYTEYYATVNLSNLLKFIDLRTHDGAQWEIQKVAEGCQEIAKDLWPAAIRAWDECKKNDTARV